MPGPHKRTRSGTAHNQDENEQQEQENSAVTTPTPTPTRTRRQAQAQPQPLPTTAAPSTPTGLHRTASLFTSRRTNNSSHNATPYAFGSSPTAGGNSPGVGVLTRTQSTPSIASSSRANAKSIAVAGGGGGGVGDKGEGPSTPLGPRRSLPGRGKENIPPPPKKDDDGTSSGSRKRLRVGGGRNSTGGSRARSGSVSSLRSETPSTSGRPSLGPSSSFSRYMSRLPSPAPSVDSLSVATPSTEADNQLDIDRDIDATPTKARVANDNGTRFDPLPTPPLSSPLGSGKMGETTKRMGLVRMDSSFSASGNPYKHLKSFLRLSSSASSAATVEEAIIGRAHEKTVLKQYLASETTNEVGMYVSGPPGTGKTALVTALGHDMREQVADARVVEFGCMGIKPNDIWVRLGEGLDCEATEQAVCESLQSGPRTLIILDEIDSLLPPAPASTPASTSLLLSRLFALPLLAPHIKLVAISNTLDLTIRARLALPDNHTPRVLPFKAYGASEMTDILLARIASASSAAAGADSLGQEVKVDPKAVELLTRKVEASNGDLRNCLGCLTSAVTLAEAEWTKKQASSSSPGASAVLVKVSLPHTIKAFNSHTQQLKAAAGSAPSGAGLAASATGKKIRSVPLQGKFVLVSILVCLSRARAGLSPTSTSASPSSSSSSPMTKSDSTTSSSAGAGGLTTANLFATYTTLLSHHSSPFPPSHESDYRDLLSNLEVLGLVKLTTAKRAKGPSVELCVKEDEIRDALDGQGVADAEVRKMLEREDAKVQSAMAKAQRAAAAAVALLGDETF